LQARQISPAEHLIRELYSITNDYRLGFATQLHRLLALGRERLGMDIGIVARVDGPTYHVVQAHLAGNGIVPSDKFDLASTYCERTLAADGPIGFVHAGSSEMRSHPAYAEFGLESYLGTPIRTAAGVFGTLNFSSSAPRDSPFDDVDVDAVQLMATWISGELARRELVDRVRHIEALIPICAECKQIRTALGDWQQLEHYLGERADMEFTHGVCPDCEPMPSRRAD